MNALRTVIVWLALALVVSTSSFAATSSNTVVRFQLRNGVTIFGNIDVELHDHDKPLTVSNFLHYVRSGAFDRSILHRVVPDFIVQGGQYTVPNPYVPLPANYMNRIVEGAPIPNEATNNRVIPNTFGTLAMALSADGTNVNRNSGTTSWYFNTANNTDDLPEFTVFGKVKSGLQYLNHFNSLQDNKGIINMFSFEYLFSSCDLVTIDSDTDVGLSELPVAYKFFDCPRNDDLFNVTISVLSSPTNTTDSAAPAVTIISPANNGTVTSNTVTVTGTVRDSIAVQKLNLFTSFGAELSPVITGNNWSQTISNLPAGANFVVVEAADANGNRVTVKSSFTHAVQLPITIATAGTGTGKLQGITNGQSLFVGQRYTISSKADAGNFFSHWLTNNGLAEVESPLTFTMTSNLTVTAVFETNLFTAAQGTYNGLFYPTNDSAALDNSGSFSLKLNDRGSYSAKLSLQGAVIPLSGAFGFSGSNTHFVFNHPTIPGFTRVQLVIDLTGGRDQVTGLITNQYSRAVGSLQAITNVFTNLTQTNIVITNLWVTNIVTSHWKSALTADRTTFNAKGNPAPQAGKYTVVLPHDTNSVAGPAGDGFGTVNVSTAGGITFAGALPDGTKITQKTSLSKNGDWPLYVPLYKGKGSLISWVNFTSQSDSDLLGLFNWFKQTQTSKYYAGGFTNEALLVGSRFVPSATNNIFGLSNALVSFLGGNLSADFTNAIGIDAKNKVTNLGSNKLSLSLNKSSGTFKGSVTPPAGGKALSFSGAILQKQTNGSGFLLGTNLSSRVELFAE